MKRSLFEKIHSNFLTEKSLKAQKKQKNCVSRLYKNERKLFLNSFNPSVVSDNRKFHGNQYTAENVENISDPNRIRTHNHLVRK